MTGELEIGSEDVAIDFDWIHIPASTFLMGSTERPEEQPLHDVELPAFSLARTQVTRTVYQRFLDETGHVPPPFWNEARFAGASLPAVGPSWHDAVAFCTWASSLQEELIRLPSEAEWECAAKAGREVAYPWGDAPEDLPAYAERWRDGPEPVDAWPSPHPLGLLGMGENVHEWCGDWYAADYYHRSPRYDPRGPSVGHRRSSRGGSWRHAIPVSRCAARASIPPDRRYNDFGFRVAKGSSALLRAG